MRVLAISVHPDDETLGCGGALLKYASQGDTLHWLLVTSAHPQDFSEEVIEQQAQQVFSVETAYPFTTLDWLKLPTTRLETLPLNTLIKAIEEVVERIDPEIVFVPNPSDAHSDHRVTFDAAMVVFKPFYMRKRGVCRVLACEVLSETDAASPLAQTAFAPNVFIDVSAIIERKLEILSLYESELHPDPLPRSLSAIRALARSRGATIGVEYAEAFMLIREVISGK